MPVLQHDAVKAVGEELCPQRLRRFRWARFDVDENPLAGQRTARNDLAAVAGDFAFARVEDVRHTLTPQLSAEDNALLLIDLGKGPQRAGRNGTGAGLSSSGDKPRTCVTSAQLSFYDAMQALIARVNYWRHDRFRRRSAGDAWPRWPCRPAACRSISPRWAMTIWLHCSARSWAA